MKKTSKLLSIILSLVMLFSMTAGLDFSAYALPSSGSCGNNVTYTYTNSNGIGVLIISGTGAMKNYSSSSSNQSPFYKATGINYVIIKDGVTSIGDSAFYGCTGLKELTMPASAIIYNSSNTFYNCSNIEKVTLTKGTGIMQNYETSTSSATNTYYQYTPWYISRNSIKEIIIKDGVTSIGDRAFDGCTGLTSVTIPDSVTSIGYYAFSGCTGLTKVNINSIEAWCEISFSDFSPLYYAHNLYLNDELVTDLVIPDSVTSIGDYAFKGCTGLTSVEIPDSVTSIGSNAFCKCTGLTSVTIGNSVTSIGSNAFSGCTGLTSVTIGNSVTSIGGYAFSGCTGLTKVNINSIEAWCEISFSDFSPLYYAHNLYLNDELVTDLVIPDSVTSIGDYAFSGCTSLTSITIPNSVTSIGDYAFLGCRGLTSVEIPDSVTSIGSYAFKGCTGLTSVEIPDSVTSIGSYAFKGCTGLTSVTIPDSVTSIDWGSFSDCTGLTSITIPDSVTSIGSYAFYECTGLTSVTIGNSVTSIGSYAFSGCTGLTSITIPDSVTSIGDYAFKGCTGLETAYLMNKNINCQNLVSYMKSGSTLYAYDSTDASIYCSIYGINYVSLDKCEDVGHRFVLEETVSPTCTQIGKKIYVCSACGYSYFDTISSTGHTPNEPVQENINKTSCNKAGTCDSVVYCKVCKAEISRKQETIEATSHSYETKIIAPNCIYQGYTEHKCSICGETYIDSFVDTTDIHIYKSAITTQPTCTTKGVKTFTCSVCGDSYTEDIAMVEHTIVTDKAVAPTCKTSGLTEGSHCSTCGTVIVAQMTVNATHHSPATAVEENRTEATCQKAGSVDLVIYCSICNEELSRTTSVIPVVEHSYAQTVIAPTCESKGYTLNKCVYCGESYKDNFVDTTDIHSYKTVVTVQPTCTEKGVEKHSCTICGDTYNTDIEMIEHTAVTDNAVAPTCTTTGLTEGSHCSVCGTVLVAQTAVTAPGHESVSMNNAVAPTCTKEGKESDTKCSTCGVKLTTGKTIAATGHSYTTKVVKPTYAANGYTLHSCSVCKSSYKDAYTNKLTVAKPTISKVTSPKSKQIKVTWGKKSYTGYQVQIATDKKFTKNKKSATIKSAKTVTKTFTKLKGKTKYYVRVRAYKTYNGKNYYSAWSTVKTVTTKK